ncbi:myosin light chain 5 [Pteropus alecto]|uniref:myosin light chain 5 n=1 Tax=Pteropus alecto TaxID=9402 RepID=UPI00076860DA|nr:myosin light chain 5 [Pteropus alecto]
MACGRKSRSVAGHSPARLALHALLCAGQGAPALQAWSEKDGPSTKAGGPGTSLHHDREASRKTKKKEGGALRAQRASSNVFSNFEQTQIQEFKEAFTLMDQNRDGFIDKEDLKDTYASLGKINVKDDELDAMLKEASGPINFTMFLNMFGEKLSGTDTEETILNAFKMLDPDGKGSVNKDYIKRLLMSQADKMTAEEVDQMLQFATIDAAGNLDYKALSYVLTHGEEKD